MRGRKTPVACAVSLLLAFCAPASWAREYLGIGDADYLSPGSLSGGDLRGWSMQRIVAPHSLRVAPYIAGLSATRFEIRPDDRMVSDGYRAELRDPYVASPGEVVWYRFRTLIPADFPLEHSVVLAQWHDRKSDGRPAARPPVALRMVNGFLHITLWNDTVFARDGGEGDGVLLYRGDGVPRECWLEFVLRARWLADANGVVQVWLNDNPIVDYRGAVGYRSDVHGPYFKLGIYTVHEFERPMHVYHTNFVRRATGAELLAADAGNPAVRPRECDV